MGPRPDAEVMDRITAAELEFGRTSGMGERELYAAIEHYLDPYSALPWHRSYRPSEFAVPDAAWLSAFERVVDEIWPEYPLARQQTLSDVGTHVGMRYAVSSRVLREDQFEAMKRDMAERHPNGVAHWHINWNMTITRARIDAERRGRCGQMLAATRPQLPRE